MSLRINTLVRKIPHIILALIGLFLLGCIVKVAIWEHIYYSEKEGSTRHAVEEVGVSAPESVELDETEIPNDKIYAHPAAPDKPRYLMGAFMNRTMGENAKVRIFEVGLTSSGAMGTRASIFDAAWYRNSGKPGNGGTLLINGHNGGPSKDGIFKDLHLVKIGDIISIERGDGEIFNYAVHEIKILPLTEANQHMSNMMKSPIPGVESLSLISCTGEWSQQQRTYLSRAMVRATLVENTEQ